MSSVRPTVRKSNGVWVSCVTRGFSGNYESQLRGWGTWREAYDWAYECVKNWKR